MRDDRGVTGARASTDTDFCCRGCGSPRTGPVVDLGAIPASDAFPSADDRSADPRWPLRLFLCRDCSLAQLGPTRHPQPEAPRAVESATALAHAAASSAEIVALEGLHAGDTVIEIDSHHGGSWLGGFVAAGLSPRAPDDRADLVADVHGLAHEAELAGPLAAHARRLAPGGRLVLEFHHLLSLVEQRQIDTIRHGHWVYLSLLCMQRLLRRHGLVVTRAVRVPVFGGSLRLTAARAADHPQIDASVEEVAAAERAAGLDTRDAYEDFARLGRRVADDLREHLRAARAAGRTVAGYGAPSKAPVLLGVAAVDSDLLPYTVDLAAAKHGRRLPGTGIPIRAPEELLRDRPDEVVVLTWDIADEVVAQLRAAAAGSGWEPRFYLPLPEARYYE